jgi:hypothetical protein
MTFAAFLCILSPVLANVAPRNEPPNARRTTLPTTAKDQSPDPDKSGAATAPAPEEKSEKPKLVLTDDTEVMLDGVRCKFADVPATADIVTLEVAADKKTITKIHFQSKK